MKRGKCRKATKGARPPRRRRWQTESDGEGASADEAKWIFRALRKKDERGSPPTREVCETVWMLGCFKTLRNNRLIDPLLLFIHNRLIGYTPTLSRGFYFPLLIPFLFFRVVLLAFLWFCYKLFVLPEFYWICPKIRFFAFSTPFSVFCGILPWIPCPPSA